MNLSICSHLEDTKNLEPAVIPERINKKEKSSTRCDTTHFNSMGEMEQRIYNCLPLKMEIGRSGLSPKILKFCRVSDYKTTPSNLFVNEVFLKKECNGLKCLSNVAQFTLLRIFQRLGVFKDQTKCYPYDQLLYQLKVIPEWEDAVKVYLYILKSAGYIAQTRKGWKLSKDFKTMFVLGDYYELGQQLDLIESKYPELKKYLDLLGECVCFLPKILRGEINFNHIILPNLSNNIEIFFDLRFFQFFRQEVKKAMVDQIPLKNGC